MNHSLNGEVLRKRAHAKLILVAVLFLAPLIGAALVYYVFPGLRPSTTSNYGQLVDPARPIPAFQFTAADGKEMGSEVLKEKWSVVYLGRSDCGATCRERLTLFRQVRLALGKDMGRVQRVYLAPDADSTRRLREALAAEQPDLVVLGDRSPAGQRTSDFFQPRETDAVYLLDPHGNWLMVYPASAEPRGIYKDLKRLLKLSNIG